MIDGSKYPLKEIASSVALLLDEALDAFTTSFKNIIASGNPSENLQEQIEKFLFRLEVDDALQKKLDREIKSYVLFLIAEAVPRYLPDEQEAEQFLRHLCRFADIDWREAEASILRKAHSAAQDFARLIAHLAGQQDAEFREVLNGMAVSWVTFMADILEKKFKEIGFIM